MGIDALFDADLEDMQALRRCTKGPKFIMTVIDIFSKRAYANQVKNKSGKEMLFPALSIDSMSLLSIAMCDPLSMRKKRHTIF